jgi:hypothetical protein
MATIHVARDGANIGSFSEEEVREGLRTGRFLSTDMAWEEGMPDWRPLLQVMAGKSAAAPPTSGVTGTSALPVSSSTPSSSASPAGGGLPWEHRNQLGILKAFFDTVSMVLTRPFEAFALMKTEGDLMGPLLFALIGGCAGMIVSSLLQIALHSIGFMADRQLAMFGLGLVGVWAVISIVFIPVMVIFGVFLCSGIWHLCLMMVGGAKKPFETTFRVVCFSSGSTLLFYMIPCCGSVIACLWNIVLECIGLARAHETDTGKAVMAVLLPLIVCCGGGLLIVVLMGGFGALSQSWRH